MHSKRLTFVLLVLAIVVSSCSNSENIGDTSLKRYPFKNVHVRYVFSGAGNGSEELYIANYGEFELVKSNYVGFLGGRPLPNNRTVLTRFAEVFITTPGSSSGQQLRIRSLDSLYKLKADFPLYTEILDSVLEQGKFQLEGTEVVAGVTTQRWRQVMGNVTLCFYKGLVLKRIIEDQNGGALIQTAVSIDTLWNVDTSLFIIPKAITFESNPAVPPPPQAQ